MEKIHRILLSNPTIEQNHCLVCPTHPETATLVKPMAWVWGAGLCLSGQWKKGGVFRKPVWRQSFFFFFFFLNLWGFCFKVDFKVALKIYEHLLKTYKIIIHKCTEWWVMCLPVFSGSWWCAGKLSGRFWRGVGLRTCFQSRESCSYRHTSLPHSPETIGKNCYNKILLVSTTSSMRLAHPHTTK